eukprot:986456-Rhodomonas_salina.1
MGVRQELACSNPSVAPLRPALVAPLRPEGHLVRSLRRSACVLCHPHTCTNTHTNTQPSPTACAHTIRICFAMTSGSVLAEIHGRESAGEGQLRGGEGGDGQVCAARARQTQTQTQTQTRTQTQADKQTNRQTETKRSDEKKWRGGAALFWRR